MRDCRFLDKITGSPNVNFAPNVTDFCCPPLLYEIGWPPLAHEAPGLCHCGPVFWAQAAEYPISPSRRRLTVGNSSSR